MKKLLNLLGFDQAIFYVLIGRGWGLTSGFVTLLLIVRFLDIHEQGYYYTFASLLAMQIFFELGMSYVIMQFASHEMAHLSWTNEGLINGDNNAKSRLRSLALLVGKWYTIVAICVVAVILPSGWIIFSFRDNHTNISWQMPWIWLVFVAAFNIFLMPWLAILEGCGRIVEIARLRMYQNILGSFLAWLVLILGGGISALPAMNTGMALAAIFWLWCRKRVFLKDLIYHTIPGEIIKWKTEIWPFQWKIAISWLCGYFIFQAFVPILFFYQGSIQAGQMGMSMAISNALMSIAMAWMNTKAPGFGILVAQKDYKTLDRNFSLGFIRSLSLMVFLGILLCTANLVLHIILIGFSNRVLDPLPFSLLMLAAICNYVTYAQSTYLRAHKKEPFMLISILSAILNCISTFVLGQKYGATGVVVGYLMVCFIIGVGGGTYVFYSKRREWRINASVPNA